MCVWDELTCGTCHRVWHRLQEACKAPDTEDCDFSFVEGGAICPRCTREIASRLGASATAPKEDSTADPAPGSEKKDEKN